MKYERLTIKDKDGNWQVWEDDYSHPFEALQTAIDKLAELEDKIEQGKLIEFPRIIRYVCYYSGLEKYVVQWETNEKIKSKTFWNEKEAEKKLKELKGE